MPTQEEFNRFVLQYISGNETNVRYIGRVIDVTHQHLPVCRIAPTYFLLSNTFRCKIMTNFGDDMTRTEIKRLFKDVCETLIRIRRDGLNREDVFTSI